MNTLQFSAVESDYPHPLVPDLRGKIPLVRVITNLDHFEAQLEGMETLIDPRKVEEGVRLQLARSFNPLDPRLPCSGDACENNGLVVVARVIPGEALNRFPKALPALLQYTGAYFHSQGATHAMHARAGVVVGRGFLNTSRKKDFLYELSEGRQTGSQLVIGDLPQELERRERLSPEDLLAELKKLIKARQAPFSTDTYGIAAGASTLEPAYTEADVEADLRNFLESREKRRADLERLLRAL